MPKTRRTTVSVTKIWDVAKREYEDALGQRVSTANARLLFLTALEVMYKMVDSLRANEQIFFGDWLKAETAVRKERQMPPLFKKYAHPANELALRGIIPAKQTVMFKLTAKKGRRLRKPIDNGLSVLAED